MHALFATLAIVVLACKMAAAGGNAWCYECTAESAAKCIPGAKAVLCSRDGYDSLKREEVRKQSVDKFKDDLNQKTENLKDQHDKEEKEKRDKIKGTTLERRRKRFEEDRVTKLGTKKPDDDAPEGLKLIEVDDTIPMVNQSERAIDWIKQLGDFVTTEDNVDETSIEAFNKRFSKEWKTVYAARVKRENGFVRRQSNRHQDLISTDTTEDNWCAIFKSKELGFHRGCGVILEGYEFKQGCYPMSGPYQGVTYCRCKEEVCDEKAVNGQASKDQASKDQASKDQASNGQTSNGQASNDQASKDQASKDQASKDQASKDDKKESNAGVKLNGKITFILMATVLTHFM